MSQTSEFTVEKWVYGGDGLARIDGQAAMIPFVLPGETVTATVARSKPGFLQMKEPRVVVPSTRRVAPPCPLFSVCGGCHYQHADYPAQVEWKRDVLREVLLRVGKLEIDSEIGVICGPPWEYRNRSQFHLAQGKIGYLESGSRFLVPLEDRCPISSPGVNRALDTLRALMRDRRFPHFVHAVEVFTNETDIQLNVLESERSSTGPRRRSGVARGFFDWCAERMPGANRPCLDYSVGPDTFRVSHQSFFQVNRFLIDRLVGAALDGASGESALDLYAGVGLFSLPLARRFRNVTAVESSPAAVRDLEFNAARAAVEPAQVRASAELYLEGLVQSPDFVLADPPRSGLGKQVVKQLLRLSPARIHIVACDPATLARDLKTLVDGGYQLRSLTMVDLFPQTYHIESVAKLERRT